MKSMNYASNIDAKTTLYLFLNLFFRRKIAYVVETKESMMSEEIRILDSHSFFLFFFFKGNLLDKQHACLNILNKKFSLLI